MPTSSPPANNSMRQQLDELDALLQRMLSLPVNQTDDSSSESPARYRAETSDPSPTPMPNGTRRQGMTLLDGSAPIPVPQSAPASSPHWNINLNPQQGSSILGAQSPAAQRATSASAPPIFRAETVAYASPHREPTPQPPMPSHVPSSLPPLAPPRASAPPPVALPLLPLVAVNRVFDGIMLMFGPPGQWFCTQAGRNLLGFAGLALVFGSVAWGAAGWFGWPR